jgi:hypothetical protein
MKGNAPFIWLGAGILALLLVSGAANANTVNGDLDLSSLESDYGSDAVNRLNSIYAQLLSRGYSTQQILYMLSQILFESGMFTPSGGNQGLMNQNNYAGLTVVGGGYASYPSVSAFIDAYLGFMTKGSDPVDANSLNDFNNRLVQNGY